MNKKYFYQKGIAGMKVVIIIGVIAVVAILAGVAIPKFISLTQEAKVASEKADIGEKTMPSPTPADSNMENMGQETMPDSTANPAVEDSGQTSVSGTPSLAIKEFTMTAYYDSTGMHYSLSEIKVKKGDRVRVKVTNTKGMHDFTLDEFSINKDLPMNEEVIIEFTADKLGDFIYYCSKPGHRAGGQWGTLKITE